MDNPNDRPAPCLELEGIVKRYGGVTALQDVCFSAARGSIHAVLGENGAGKSTLMKILAGVVTPDAGTLRLDGRPVTLRGPADALAQGIVCVFQELSLVPHLGVAENICIAAPPRNRLGLVDARAQAALAREALAAIGCEHEIDLHARCGELPLPQRQLVEIAKALVRRPRVLILDEATSALGASDVQRILALLRRLRDQGTCVLFISHRMHEVDALADTCSVFRNGRHVATFGAGTRPHEQIVAMMIGRTVGPVYPAKLARPSQAAPALQVRGLGWGSQLRDVHLEVRPGEIVGLGGLDGQGQRELLLALGGLLKATTGEVQVNGRPRLPRGPREARSDRFRVALIPEDRKTEGLMLARSVHDNLAITRLEQLARLGVVDARAEQALVQRLVAQLQVKAPDPSVAVSTLSGGNQQKVVLAKWLATEPRLLLLMDPTRGVDVGTRQEIYRLFRELAQQGLAILLHSTDIDELMGLCDRVLVMYGGRIRAELSGPRLNEQEILMHAMNLQPAVAPVAPATAATPMSPSLAEAA